MKRLHEIYENDEESGSRRGSIKLQKYKKNPTSNSFSSQFIVSKISDNSISNKRKSDHPIISYSQK